MKKILLLFFCQLILIPDLFCQSDFYAIDSIQEIRIVFKERNWKHIMDSVFEASDGNGRWICDVVVNGQKISRAGIRYKGYSSVDLKDVKNPFNIDLEYSQKNRNYQGYTSLRLSNVNYDPSFVREVLSYEIARKYMPASLANFAMVYVNDTLLGLYTNIEAVNKKFISKYFQDHDNSFIKGSPLVLEYPFGENANLADTHGLDSLDYSPFYQLESDYGWSDLFNFIQVLNNEPDSVERVLNVDRALWMHAFNYALLNFDSYIGYAQNYYLYKDDNGRFNTIPWDMNMSFGSFRETDGSYNFNGLNIEEMETADPLAHLNFSISPRPLMTNLFKNGTYRRMFLAHVRTIADENFRNQLWYQRGLHIQGIIDQAVQTDTNKFYSYDFFRQNLESRVGAAGSKDEFPGIKDLIEARGTYLDTYPGIPGAPVISGLSNNPEHPQQESEVGITAKILNATNVTLYYRYNHTGFFKTLVMADDGIHSDSLPGDGIFGALLQTVGSTLQYYIYAENDTAGRFSPERAACEFYSIHPCLKAGDIALNEVMFYNSGQPDPKGSYTPWIEISNNTGEDLSLKDVVLTDDTDFPEKCLFPDTLITARGFYIVWAGENAGDPGSYCNFTLSSVNGSLYLMNQQGMMIDSLHYSTWADHKSTGRYPNGVGTFDFMEPSFSASNFTGSTPVSGFLLYPNPAKETIVVELKNENNPVEINLYDPCGRMIKQIQCEYRPEGIPVMRQAVDVSSLEGGVYYIRIVSGKGTDIKAFVLY
jgi:hypothetical protein